MIMELSKRTRSAHRFSQASRAKAMEWRSVWVLRNTLTGNLQAVWVKRKRNKPPATRRTRADTKCPMQIQTRRNRHTFQFSKLKVLVWNQNQINQPPPRRFSWAWSSRKINLEGCQPRNLQSPELVAMRSMQTNSESKWSWANRKWTR